MPHIKRTRQIEVYHQRGDSMNLKDIEEFCAKAREAGFGDKAKPWAGSHLVSSMTLSRSEPM